jgi:hypothetical protein
VAYSVFYIVSPAHAVKKTQVFFTAVKLPKLSIERGNLLLIYSINKTMLIYFVNRRIY